MICFDECIYKNNINNIYLYKKGLSLILDDDYSLNLCNEKVSLKEILNWYLEIDFLQKYIMASFVKIEEKNQANELENVKALLQNPQTTLPDVLTNQACYRAMKSKYPPLVE